MLLKDDPHMPKSTRRPFYSIFNTPDGQDCLKKLCYSTAYGATAGTIVSVYDIIGYTGASTLSNGMARWAFHVFPMAGAAGMYAAVSCIAGSVRGKDTQLNHVLAGFAAGSIYGIRFRSQKVGWGAGLLFATAGWAIKTIHLENIRVVPNTMQIPKGFHTYKRSYLTERPDPEGVADTS